MDEENDYYVVTSPWYYLLQIGMILYGIGFFGFLVLIQNANVPNTVTAPGLPWGTYYTQMFNSLYWLVLFLSVLRTFMFVIVYMAILWRASFGCSIFWLVLIIIITMADLLVVVGTGNLNGNCNGNGQKFNPCNDPEWCCASEIYTSSINGCANTIPCPVGYPRSISELSSNIDFDWFFALNVLFFVWDVLYFFFFASNFYKSPTSRSRISNVDPLTKSE